MPDFLLCDHQGRWSRVAIIFTGMRVVACERFEAANTWLVIRTAVSQWEHLLRVQLAVRAHTFASMVRALT